MECLVVRFNLGFPDIWIGLEYFCNENDEYWNMSDEEFANFAKSVNGRSFHYENKGALYIDTLEGTMKADINDWIIKGVKGEYYPCKPDIFENTYEEVKDEINK